MTIFINSGLLRIPAIQPRDRFLKLNIFRRNRLAMRTLLSDINLNFESGKGYALIGNNGAGKTTLLKVLMGVYHLTGGNITVTGSVHGTITTLGGFHPELSVHENIVLRALSYGIAFNNALAIADEVLDFAEIDVGSDEPFKNLSNGNQLKIGFSFSTALNAENLLLDEVVTVGDYRFIEKAKLRLREYLAPANLLVLATHSEQLLQNFCQIGVVMKRGLVVYTGALDRALTFYHSERYQEL